MHRLILALGYLSFFHVIHFQEILFDCFYICLVYTKPKPIGQPTRTTLSSKKGKLYLYYYNRIIFAEGTKLIIVIFSFYNINDILISIFLAFNSLKLL